MNYEYIPSLPSLAVLENRGGRGVDGNIHTNWLALICLPCVRSCGQIDKKISHSTDPHRLHSPGPAVGGGHLLNEVRGRDCEACVNSSSYTRERRAHGGEPLRTGAQSASAPGDGVEE